MAKEHTHLYFADEVLKKIKDAGVKKILEENRDYYYLGAAAPDAFYHHKKESAKKISICLHGKMGEKTNLIVLDVLKELIKRKGLEDGSIKKFSSANLAFVMGYLTHCALDIAVHPFICSLAGDYYDKDEAKRAKAVYLHRYLETYFEDEILVPLKNTKKHKLKIGLVEKTIFADAVARRFGVSIKDVALSFKKQNFNLGAFKSNAAFRLMRILERLKLFPKTSLGFFRGILKNKNSAERLIGRDNAGKFFDLTKQASVLAKDMILATNDFYWEKISEEQYKKTVSGKGMF